MSLPRITTSTDKNMTRVNYRNQNTSLTESPESKAKLEEEPHLSLKKMNPIKQIMKMNRSCNTLRNNSMTTSKTKLRNCRRLG